MDKSFEWESQLSQQRRKVDSDNFDVTVRELVRMVTDKELERAPVYQRQFRWDDAQESKLIESVFLGLPVPTIYVATNSDGTWEIVDGLQRISTLIHFVSNDKSILDSIGKDEPLRLIGLDKLDSFNNYQFSELPTPIQLSFLKRSLRITSLSDKADKNVRFDMFERLNTGGIILTPQEIRACIYRGESVDFFRELAENPEFLKLIKLKKGNRNDGTLEEIVLKAFAYKEGRSSFKGDVKNFLTAYMGNMKGDFDYSKRRELFNNAVKNLANVMDGPILRPKVGWTPVNLAEGVIIAAMDLVEDGYTNFTPKDNWLSDKVLIKFSTGGTNTNKALLSRISRAKELLMGGEISSDDSE
ncbi:hypothetical protein GCM10017783_23360 [Deinococcus piscis]|uniref:GmrSD restriction endonucleases N-terminal domain-containing protein n=1 Tax=Deinococcus piscis TaxID=394230 RepID=A0ABQ3KB54_9DEIO|nr:DUF262 domain-containing protein [Deinococcus piscis]GHG10226.1 hypothetical protein GCM10017783_23360 [Deinococcus piscis]